MKHHNEHDLSDLVASHLHLTSKQQITALEDISVLTSSQPVVHLPVIGHTSQFLPAATSVVSCLHSTSPAGMEV
jgi:hypothetical protein